MIGGTAGYKPAKNHTFSVTLSFVNRLFADAVRQDASDFIGNFIVQL